MPGKEPTQSLNGRDGSWSGVARAGFTAVLQGEKLKPLQHGLLEGWVSFMVSGASSGCICSVCRCSVRYNLLKLLGTCRERLLL